MRQKIIISKQKPNHFLINLHIFRLPTKTTIESFTFSLVITSAEHACRVIVLKSTDAELSRLCIFIVATLSQ